MGFNIFNRFRAQLSPPHLTFQSRKSRNRVLHFLSEEQLRTPDGFRLNVGSGDRPFDFQAINFGPLFGEEIDIQGNLLHLPIKGETTDTIVCTGVLEHVSDPFKTVDEIHRVLRFVVGFCLRRLSCKQCTQRLNIFLVGSQKV